MLQGVMQPPVQSAQPDPQHTSFTITVDENKLAV